MFEVTEAPEKSRDQRIDVFIEQLKTLEVGMMVEIPSEDFNGTFRLAVTFAPKFLDKTFSTRRIKNEDKKVVGIIRTS